MGSEVDGRYFEVVSGGVIFVINPSDVIYIDVDKKIIKASKAYSVAQKLFVVPGRLGQIGLQNVNLINPVQDVEIFYNAFGYVAEDSSFVKSIKDLERDGFAN